MDDEALRIGRQQVARIDAGLARANADYQEAMTNGDDATAQDAMQQYADLSAQRNNLVGAYHQQVAAEQAAAPRELSAEEKAARPLSHMTYQDAYELAQTSRYGVDDNAFRAGIAEVQRRRSRGE